MPFVARFASRRERAISTPDMHVCESSTPTAASTVCASAGQQRPNLEGARITPRPQEFSTSLQKGLALAPEERVPSYGVSYHRCRAQLARLGFPG